MKITRKSQITGIVHTREIAVTQEQLDRWNKGELIQRVMPHLSPSDREFIITGITAWEWEEVFGKEDEDKLSDDVVSSRK